MKEFEKSNVDTKLNAYFAYWCCIGAVFLLQSAASSSSPHWYGRASFRIHTRAARVLLVYPDRLLFGLRIMLPIDMVFFIIDTDLRV